MGCGQVCGAVLLLSLWAGWRCWCWLVRCLLLCHGLFDKEAVHACLLVDVIKVEGVFAGHAGSASWLLSKLDQVLITSSR
jgi:hypothetical protein